MAARRAASDIGRRHPLYPRGAVAVLLKAPAQDAPPRYLLAKRGKEPRKGSWSLPGGGINIGEATLAAAAREVSEETGLCAGVHYRLARRPFTATDAIFPVASSAGAGAKVESQGVEFHYLIVQCFGRMLPGGAEAATPGDDAIELAWMNHADIERVEAAQGYGEVAALVQWAEALDARDLLPTDDASYVIHDQFKQGPSSF